MSYFAKMSWSHDLSALRCYKIRHSLCNVMSHNVLSSNNVEYLNRQETELQKFYQRSYIVKFKSSLQYNRENTRQNFLS